MARDLHQGEVMHDKLPPPALHQTREQSKAIWARDLQGLYEHARERFADVKWVPIENLAEAEHDAEILKDSNGAVGAEEMDALLQLQPPGVTNLPTAEDGIFAHKAMVYVRASKTFKDRFFPVTIGSSTSNLASLLPSTFVSDSASLAPVGIRSSSRLSVVSTSTSSRRVESQARGSRININPVDSSSTTSRRPATAYSYGPGHTDIDAEGRLVLPDQGTPEMLKQALQWLYTGHGPPGTEGTKVSISLTDLGGHGGALDRELLGDGILPDVGLIRAQGEDGQDAPSRKQLSIDRSKLAQDLTYMWRSKLYTDVKIRIRAPENSASQPKKATAPSAYKSNAGAISKVASVSSMRSGIPSQTSIALENREFDLEGTQDEDGRLFSAHRFILCSRSPYFHQVLLNSGAFQDHPAAKQGSTPVPIVVPEIVLPSPPFTPLAMYFILGYLYSGTLSFCHRTLDLITAFSVMKCAIFLEIDALVAEVEALIREELCHGMNFPRMLHGKTVGGCNCKKCSKRIPKVLRFAVAPDVQAGRLKAGGMQYLIQGGWGDCWNKDLANLDESIQEELVAGICNQVSSSQIIATYRNLLAAQQQINLEKTDSVEILQDLLETIRESARQKLLGSFRQVAQEPNFISLLNDGLMDRSLRDFILQDLAETVNKADFCQYAPAIYESLGIELLERSDGPQEHPLLAAYSSGREAVEDLKNKVIAVIKRRWLQMRPVGSFDSLRDSTLKDLSAVLQVPQLDLMKPKTPPIRKVPLPAAPRQTAKVTKTADDAPLGEASSAPVGVGTTAGRGGIRSASMLRNAPATTVRERSTQTPGTFPRTRNAVVNNLTTSSLRPVTGAPAGNTSAMGRRSALGVPSLSGRVTTTILAPTSSTSRSMAGPPNQSERPGRVIQAGPVRSVPEATRGASISARQRTASSPSEPSASSRAPANAAAGTASAVGSRQRPTLPSTRAPMPSMSTRVGPKNTLQRLQAESSNNTAPTALRVPASRAVPIAERKPIATPAIALRNSSSSASLRNTPARAVSRVGVAGKKVLVAAPERPLVGQSSKLPIASKERKSILPVSAQTSVSSRITSIEKQNGIGKRPAAKSTLDTAASPISSGLSSLRLESSRPVEPELPAETDPAVELDLPVKPTSPVEANTPIEQSPSVSTADAIAGGSKEVQDDQHSSNIATHSSSNSLSGMQKPGSGRVALEQTPPRTLRPLKLVEKRHSLSPKPSQTEAVKAVLTSTQTQSVVIKSDPEPILSRGAVAPDLPLVEDSIEPSTRRTSQKGGRYGLGLGITLPTQTPMRPSDIAIASPVTGASPSVKYHPASAFDPPPRIPSISVTDSARAEEEDDCEPHDKSKGASLSIGIPCVIYVIPSLAGSDTIAGPPASSRTRLKAVCRYIGQVSGMPGEWIGVEINLATLSRLRCDVSQDPEEPLAANGLHDGSWNGIRYYKIHQNASTSPAISQGSFSRPLSPFGSPYDTSREVSGRFRPMASRGLASAPTSFDTRSFASRLRGSSMTSSRRASLTQDAAWDGSMSFMSNPETSWVSGGNDSASNRKCGLWIRPSDVVLVPGAHD